MSKIIFILLFYSIIGTAQNPKIGVVDVDFLLDSLSENKDLDSIFIFFKSRADATINFQVKSMESYYKQIIEGSKGDGSPVFYKKAEDSLQRLKLAHEKTQTLISTVQKEVEKEIFLYKDSQIRKAINIFASEQQYDIVLDKKNGLFNTLELDITSNILAILNIRKSNFITSNIVNLKAKTRSLMEQFFTPAIRYRMLRDSAIYDYYNLAIQNYFSDKLDKDKTLFLFDIGSEKLKYVKTWYSYGFANTRNNRSIHIPPWEDKRTLASLVPKTEYAYEVYHENKKPDTIDIVVAKVKILKEKDCRRFVSEKLSDKGLIALQLVYHKNEDEWVATNSIAIARFELENFLLKIWQQNTNE